MLAEELGPAVRILKLDSDKYPRLASLLKVQGLPTLVYFDGGNNLGGVSSEVQRVEGALTKGQLVEFLNTVEFINKRVEEGR
jgi:thioredoxin-like negative regulator of GroEL